MLNIMCEPTPQARQKIPNDGPGPRGLPDCYYTSRVLDSTFRYVKFVKKLRQEEEDQRKGKENNFKALRDRQINDFFNRCDKKGLVNKVAYKVKLCLESYEQDVMNKRNKLKNLLEIEERENIRKFVEQMQAGAEQIWEQKKQRLQYLLEKRRKEHEEKFKETPLSKCVHVLPCLIALRAKEAQEIQLYQIKEKQARKMAEIESDKMWHAVAMKESDALAARMEQDAIERLRRDQECKQYADYQLEQRKLQRDKEKEMLREEARRFKSIWEADIRTEKEAEQKRIEKSIELKKESELMMKQRQQMLARKAIETKLIQDTWDSLAGQGRTDELEHIKLLRRKERELDECNRKMIEMRDALLNDDSANEKLINEVAKQQQDYLDKKRCDYITWSQKTNRDVRKAMMDQIRDRAEAREILKMKLAEQNEYHRQLRAQLEELVKHKAFTDMQRQKLHQKQLLDQIEYNKILKERALQEEMDQRKKYKLATEEYQQEIQRMLNRPFFSDEQHPFMKPMARGLHMREKCPCSKPDYCAASEPQTSTSHAGKQ